MGAGGWQQARALGRVDGPSMEMLSKVREARAGGIGRLGYRRPSGRGGRSAVAGFAASGSPRQGARRAATGAQVKSGDRVKNFGGEKACVAWGAGSAGLCPIMNSAFP